MTTKTPRICEHEERQIASIMRFHAFKREGLSVYWENIFAAEKIVHYLNTKKPCAKCSKKKI